MSALGVPERSVGVFEVRPVERASWPPAEALFAACARAGGTATLLAASDGVVRLALGEAAGFTASGPEAVVRLGAAWRSMCHRQEGAGVAMPPATVAWSFDPGQAMPDLWRQFPAAMLSVPSLAVVWPGAGEPQAVTVGGAAVLPDALGGAATSGSDAAWHLEPATAADRRRFMRAVLAARDAVRRRDLAKVVVARRVTARCAGEPDLAAVLRRLRHRSGPVTVYATCRRGDVWLGASPEMLVRRRGQHLESLALAGSAPRGADAAADAALGQRLLADPKERLEHELVRVAVARALAPLTATLDAPAQPSLRRLATVQHLATPFRGSLRPGADLWQAAAALHPTPAVAGEPRDAAMAHIRAAEPEGRGLYSGVLGHIGPDGDGEFTVALRGALIRGRQAHLWAGCGIVAESDPEREWAESSAKLAAVAGALTDD